MAYLMQVHLGFPFLGTLSLMSVKAYQARQWTGGDSYLSQAVYRDGEGEVFIRSHKLSLLFLGILYYVYLFIFSVLNLVTNLTLSVRWCI